MKIRKIGLGIIGLIVSCSIYAQSIWCPAEIICSGVDIVTCKKGNFSDKWKLDREDHKDILDPYFHNTGATYDANSGVATCAYSNSSSQGLGLIPIKGDLYPNFKHGLYWKWADASKEWASCVGHDNCPFLDYNNK